MRRLSLIPAALLALMPAAALADLITWTDWTRIGAETAAGTMGGVDVSVAVNAGSINLDRSQTACGFNWWTQPDPTRPAYTGGTVDNAPTDCEQVSLVFASDLTVTFSSPVDTLYMALLSIGQPGLTVTYDFDTAFTVDSSGVGFWSSGVPGTYVLGAGDTMAMNEFHGVLKFSGPVSSIRFTTSPFENWHAFTFGMTTTSVPEPGTMSLLGIGLLGMSLLRRRKR